MVKVIDDFATIDIETDASGKPTEFGFYDGVNFKVFYDVESFVMFILNRGGTYYAHAGMRFDYCIIYSKLMEKVDNIDVSTSGTQGIYMSIKYKKKHIFLLDSYRLVPASLASLTKQFNTTVKKQKLDVMPWELSASDRLEYLKDDCISLHLVLQKFWEVIDNNFSVEGKKIRAVTLASLALKVYNLKFLPKVLESSRSTKIHTSSGKLEAFESRSYFGGLVWVSDEYSGKVLDDITVYDVNSMYPYAMVKYKYPISYIGYWTDKFDKKSVGLWHVEYEDFSGVPFVFDIISKSLGRSGEAIIDTDTYLYLLKVGAYVKLRIGFIYEQTDYMFKEFVDTCYDIRIKYGSASPLGFTSKILMNSLYGKFAEKPIKRVLTSVQPSNINGAKIYTSGGVSDGREFYDYFKEVFLLHRFPVISSLVTLRSRLHLRQLVDTVKGDVVYLDTDSIHIFNDQVSFEHSTLLGGLKKEFSGKAIYLGKKLYQLFNTDDTVYKIVAKGIPQKSAIGLDLRQIDQTAGAKVSYGTFTSLLTVVKDPIAPFSFQTKHRTIRNTVKPVT